MSLSNIDVIDCHIHPAIDERSDTNWFHPSGDLQFQVDALRRAGIAQACGAPVESGAPQSFDEVRSLNDKALALRDRFPDFYIPGMQVHPHFPDESCREIERCCGGEGVRWIGELVGYMMGFGDEYATEAALTIMRAAGAHGATVNFHCHDFDVIDRLCSAVPDVKLVLAHFGGSSEESIGRMERAAKYPNLHIDVSGACIARYGIVRKAVEIAGAEKFLFGTDYPINNPALCLHGVLYESLSEQDARAVLRGNFLRLVEV